VLPEGGYDVLVTSAGFASGFESVPLGWKAQKNAMEAEAIGLQFPRYESRWRPVIHIAIAACFFTGMDGRQYGSLADRGLGGTAAGHESSVFPTVGVFIAGHVPDQIHA
jgi:hypothetical protein